MNALTPDAVSRRDNAAMGPNSASPALNHALIVMGWHVVVEGWETHYWVHGGVISPADGARGQGVHADPLGAERVGGAIPELTSETSPAQWERP